DFIINSIPNKSNTIYEACMALVQEWKGLSKLSRRGFTNGLWGSSPLIPPDNPNLVYFEISVDSETILFLYLGPTDQPDVRKRIYDLAREASPPFSPRFELTGSYTFLVREILLSKVEMDRSSAEECANLARERLRGF